MVQLILLFILLIAAFVRAAQISEDLVVTLPDGKVRGASYKTPNNKTYYGFRGIPFAAPPVGNLRLEPPQPVQPWDGIRNANSDGHHCISFDYSQSALFESEDCLFINVYVPTLQPTEKLPVMFWIYGGGFNTGYSDKFLYGPDFLIEENVIVVSFNYRLGPFGFLSAGDKILPGNLGLKDQNFALKWTYKNIELFGGDPQKITIFGQSAGGASTGLHLVSKHSAGLFRAAIVESGSALVPWAIEQNPKNYTYAVAKAISGGVYINNTQKLKEFFKNRAVYEIITAAKQLENIHSAWPVLEEESDDAFLTQSNYERLVNGSFNKVPIMIGVCSGEYLLLAGDLNTTKSLANEYDNNERSLIPSDLYPNASVEAASIKDIQSIYLKESENFSSNFLTLSKFISDSYFIRGVLKHAELTSKYVPVYLYQFSYYGRSFVAPFIEGAGKAAHSAELPFILNMFYVSSSTNPDDLLTQKRATTLWSNFAKYLNPTPEKSDIFANLTWPRLDKDMKYLNINNTLEIRQHLRGEALSKWNAIFETYGKKPFITF